MKLCTVPRCERKHYAKGYCELHYMRVRKYGTPEGGPTNHAPPEERFWRGVNKDGPNGCWIYERGLRRGVYGRFQIGGKGSKHVSAHRYSYELHKGPIPEGMVIMHSCDTPRCVNPDHLRAGTHKENTADMIAKGRKVVVAPKGEGHLKARLTEELVLEIRSSTKTNRAWAERLGVSITCIRKARVGETWKHI